MSGCSSSTTCPNCDNEADLYTDSKPYEYSIIQCNSCGLVISPKVEYMDLDELNANRQDSNMDKLDKLPEQKENI